MMQCPNCRTQMLKPILTRQGVEIDMCSNCQGIWLDEGEIFHFSKNANAVAKKLKEAEKNQLPVSKLSPRTGEAMVEIHYPGGPLIDLCKKTGGMWFDSGEIKTLLAMEKALHMEIDKKAVSNDVDASIRDAERHERIKQGLLPLPNLFLRSTITLTGLYAILGAFLIATVEFLGVSPAIAVGVGITIILIQFLLGPFLMDLSLRWLYRMEWVSPNQLPAHLNQFVGRVVQEKKINYPRFGIINDGAPQAFTYGHTPNNARIVISRGILELLEPDEAEAVVAHEMGHAIHWDMLLMTIVQLVPLILYYIYRTLIDMKTSGNDKSAPYRISVAIGAYILYFISEYIVLWFSRTREYHADRFSGEVTGNPSGLASALVKIAYGLAGQEKDESGKEDRTHNIEAIGALGIFDGSAARSLAITTYDIEHENESGLEKESIKGAMRWDLWNPWAKWYELNSTHPLVANRLRYLSDHAVSMGQKPFIVFDETRPESYWDEFLVDILVHLLPLIAILSVPVTLIATGTFDAGVNPNIPNILGITAFILGIALLVRFQFTYRGSFFPMMSIAALLKKVKVSAVRPVPCKVRGTIIGRGVPGYIFSEDFVMKDDTGIIFLDYRQPLAIWEFLFGLLRSGKYNGKEVTVEGWYRRSPVPFVEIKRIRGNGLQSRSWSPMLYRLTAIILIIGGLFFMIATSV